MPCAVLLCCALYYVLCAVVQRCCAVPCTMCCALCCVCVCCVPPGPGSPKTIQKQRNSKQTTRISHSRDKQHQRISTGKRRDLVQRIPTAGASENHAHALRNLSRCVLCAVQCCCAMLCTTCCALCCCAVLLRCAAALCCVPQAQTSPKCCAVPYTMCCALCCCAGVCAPGPAPPQSLKHSPNFSTLCCCAATLCRVP